LYEDQNKLELQINVTIRQPMFGNAGLMINESVKIDARDFLEMASILGEFHKLAEKYRSAHPDTK
jgi:hypothetical protein